MRAGHTVKVKSSSLPNIPNPWGIKARGAAMLDAFVLTDDYKELATQFGVDYHTAAMCVLRALEKIDGRSKLHKLIRWRDFRGLLPAASFPPPKTNPFWTTGLQARAIDLSIAGLSHVDIAYRMGRSTKSVSDHIRQGLAKVPGTTTAQRMAAWRQLREEQKRDPS